MKPTSNYINPEQFDMIIDNIPRLNSRKWSTKDIEMLFKICYESALRMNEAIRLKAEDFDLENREVYLGKTKTNKEDHASIPEKFIPELRMYLDLKKGSLFPGLNYAVVYSWLDKLGEMLDIKALTTSESETGEKTKTHIFRKSKGKDMIFGLYDNRKAPLNVIMEKLRHKDLTTTSKYLKVGIEGVKDWESLK